MKNYFGFITDHSGSMGHLASSAAQDFNTNIDGIKKNAIETSQDTIVTHLKCGTGRDARNIFATVNSNVLALNPINESQYDAIGRNTPLFDAISMMINQLQSVPDANDNTVSFLIMVTTDGEDNASRTTGHQLAQQIKQLQATDRWSIVFRVPSGYKRKMIQLGIPEWNIMEWEQSERGVQVSTQATSAGMDNYFKSRSLGETSTRKFYADLSDVKPEEIKATMVDISAEVSIWPVLPAENGAMIREYCEKRLGGPLLKGAAFYELTKSEPHIQDYKMLCIRDRNSGSIYSGKAARDLLGMPHHGDIRLAPHPKNATSGYDIFIQSTSVNRKLPAGSQVLYWPKVGKAFTEGPSAR
jgi:hypothetical protein